MLGPRASGVASYARALHAAQCAIADTSLLLSDDSLRAGPHGGPVDRALRWGAATLPLPRAARLRHAADGATALHGRDLFRLAQIFFDIHRRPLEIRAEGPPGIMHWSYPVPLRLAGWTNLYTVHDAIPLLHPDLTPIDPRRHRRLLDAIAKRGTALVTVSAAARDDLVATLGLAPGRVVDCSQPVSPVAADTLPHGLEPGGYLLVCGSVEPRKNIARLLAAHRLSGTALPLVVAGPAVAQGAALERAIAARHDARRLTGLDDAAIAALIAGARALLMPSLAEGFGRPVAEAMALGTPVVTSASGALAETAGGAALLVEPEDVAGLAAAIARIAGDDALCARLSAAGRANAPRFTPERFAARLADLYTGLVADPGRAAYPPDR